MILFSADFPTRITPAGVNVQGKSAAIALELENPPQNRPVSDTTASLSKSTRNGPA